jgi:hypothetical protein
VLRPRALQRVKEQVRFVEAALRGPPPAHAQATQVRWYLNFALRNAGLLGPETAYAFPTEGACRRNFRDVGEASAIARTADGRALRKGILFRMAQPRPSDIALFRMAGIRTELDLRTQLEIRHEPAEAFPWRSDTAGRGNLRYVNEAIPTWDAYDVTSRARDGAVARSMVLLAHSEGPFVIHCAAGADRTGVLVALVMKALGFSQARIFEEYGRSSSSPVGAGTDSQNLDLAFRDLVAVHGALDGYFRHLASVEPGFDPRHTVDALRARLLTA